MRKLVLAIILVLGLNTSAYCVTACDIPNYFIAAVDTTEETVPAEETNVNPTENEAVPVEEVSAETTEEANEWVSLIWSAVALIIGLLTGTITLAGKMGIKKIEKKIGFDIPDAVEEIAEGYLVKAINWTENWAKEQSEKPTSDDKMAQTIKYAMEKAAESEAVRIKIDEKGKAIVEKLLKSNETSTEATPKE